MVCFAQRLITATNTKGQKEAEKGLKGNHQKKHPFGPLLSLLVPFPKKATPFNNTNFPKPHNPISCQKGSDATLGKKKCGWAVLWRTAHSHLFLLAAADVPLITKN